MSLIAASLAAVLHLIAGLPLLESALIAVVLFAAMLALEVSSARRRDRAEFADRFEGLARATADIAREVGEMRHRVVAIEKSVAEQANPGENPLAREIGELAQLIEDVAESVAVHDAILAQRKTPKPAPAAPAMPMQLSMPVDPVPSVPPLPSAKPVSAPNGPFGAKSEEEIKTMVAKAVEAGRVELYLQPVVTLPQRKVRYYEALSRLRLADESMIEAARFLPAARAAGLMPRIDEKLVHSCVQIVRRLAARNREIGLFLNIAPETLIDRVAFAEILGYLEANRALAPSLVLELPQAAYRTLNPAELVGMSMLAERGFRFSLDRIQDFRLDPRGLHERGIRFLKVPAELMLDREAGAAGHIHPSDLNDLLSRHGIDLVAERIETEEVVVDLLDMDVRFGQGFLFAQPRPIRAEILGIERAGEAAAARAAAEQPVARTA